MIDQAAADMEKKDKEQQQHQQNTQESEEKCRRIEGDARMEEEEAGEEQGDELMLLSAGMEEARGLPGIMTVLEEGGWDCANEEEMECAGSRARG